MKEQRKSPQADRRNVRQVKPSLFKHILSCILFMAFGAFFMMLWLIEPHEIVDVAGIFWGIQ